MPCLVVLLALISPRLALVAMWLFSNILSRSFDSWIVPLIGFFVLPWTTLAYAGMWSAGTNQVSGFEKPGGYGQLLFAPGTKYHYSDAGPNWLAECLTLAYGRDLNEVMFERVFRWIDVKPADIVWRENAYRPHEIDGVKRREFGSGFSSNVNAMARLGYLYLRNGRWQDWQILPPDFGELGETEEVDRTLEHEKYSHGDQGTGINHKTIRFGLNRRRRWSRRAENGEGRAHRRFFLGLALGEVRFTEQNGQREEDHCESEAAGKTELRRPINLLLFNRLARQVHTIGQGQTGQQKE